MDDARTPLRQNPAFIISLLLLSMVFMLLVDVFFVHADAYVGELRTQVVTGLLMIIGMVGGYWIGTSYSSMRKTEIGSSHSSVRRTEINTDGGTVQSTEVDTKKTDSQ